MATENTENTEIAAPTGNPLFNFSGNNPTRTLILIGGAALTIALMVGVWLWGQQPEYRVLFSNFNDKDGGAIVASLQQLNIPYKYSDGGGAILVPANQVHDARLKLASQGLPKGGNVGFELMENQKLGVSQFLEQVNFQRALEGELARSIQAVSAVQTARVHLAIPKSSVFIRDQQKPTASVLLNLYNGRTLDPSQVSAIVHLVASSIPDLPAKNVTIVDQNGNLLSDTSKQNGHNNLDPSQLKYVQDFQQDVAKRVESIIVPLVGANNVRAEATADIDFSKTEQAAETYRPNGTPDAAAIRSQQLSEAYGKQAGASGVPGALSNQPPVPATAPLVTSASATAASNANASGLSQKDSTVNYEVDKTIRYTQQGMGGLKRLSVAIVINHKTETDKNGKVSTRPLSDSEKAQITELAKDAMGFNKDRGDSINIVNSPFVAPEKEKVEDVPLWKQPDMIQMAKEIGKYAFIALILAYLYFSFLKPTLDKIMGRDPATLAAEEAARKKIEREEELLLEEEEAAIVNLSSQEEEEKKPASTYESNMEMARQLAANDPKIVANVIKAWVSNE